MLFITTNSYQIKKNYGGRKTDTKAEDDWDDVFGADSNVGAECVC